MDAITPKQAATLDLIEEGHDTIEALATITGLEPRTVYGHARNLHRKGLVSVTPVPTSAGGKPKHVYQRTSKARPTVRRYRSPTRPRPAQGTPEPAGVFDAAPRLTLDADPRWGTATREHVELAARKALSNQPAKHGRKAITARHLANLTGMPYLDALGALYRITERQTGGIRVYEPEGRSATFYVGPKYRPAFGSRA